MSSVRTLGEIAARTSMLAIACSRRERRARYGVREKADFQTQSIVSERGRSKARG